MADSTSQPNEEKYNVVELPSSVHIKESAVCKGEPGAFCKSFIKKDTRFGPYKGEIVKPGQKSNLDYRYAWEVFEKRSNVLKHTIHASDSKKSNWMRNVNSARFYEEQNILSVQEGFSIYYVAMKDIKPGEELLTWFDPKLLKRTERRRQTKKERKRVGYTIELVPWSDEKKFVPEIIETKRARKKKVMSDMISFDEDAPLVQRSLTSVLKASKNKDAPFIPKMDKQGKNSGVLANESSSYSPNGFASDAFDYGCNVSHSSRKSSDTTSSSTTSPGKSESPALNTAAFHRSRTKMDRRMKGILQSPNKILSKRGRKPSHRAPRGRPKIQKMENDTGDTSKPKDGNSGSIFKPFEPSLLRPIVFRKKENGCTEVEDHDEIYTTSRVFRNQCDDLCLCLNKSEMLSSKSNSDSSIPSQDENKSQKVKEGSCVQFALVPDHQSIIVCNKIIFRCDICESAYNHAFSLKRHYLKIHINHRYLSKKDIIECQIDTFHSGVENMETHSDDRKNAPLNESPSKTSIKENIEIRSLKDLAGEKLGFDLKGDQHKILKGEKHSRQSIPVTASETPVQTSFQENEKKASLSSDDLNSCESINSTAVFEKDQSTEISAAKDAFKDKENSRKSISNDLPDNIVDDGKDDSQIKPVETKQISNGLSEKERANGDHKSSPAKVPVTESPTELSTDSLKSEVTAIPDPLETQEHDDMKGNGETGSEMGNSPLEETVSESSEKSESHSVIKSDELEDRKDTDIHDGILLEEKIASNDLSKESERLPFEMKTVKVETDGCPDSNAKDEIATYDSDEADIDLIQESFGSFKEKLNSKDNVDTVKLETSVPDDKEITQSETLSPTQVCATDIKSVTSSSVLSPSSSSMLPSSPLPTKPVASTESKKQTAQQQVILLVPIISPTAAKPTASQQSLLSAGTLPKSPTQSAAGIPTGSPGSISLLTSQSSLPMMVLSTVSSAAALSLPPGFLQSQGFAPIAQLPGTEGATPLPSGGSLQTFIVSNQPKSSTGHSPHTISTLNTNLSSVLSVKTSSCIQPGNNPTLFMSASNFSGQDEAHQPADLYRCHMCVLVFKTTTELKHHIKNDPHRFKGGIKQYACSKCSLRFRNKHNLNRHILIHHQNREEEDTDRKFRCLTCGKGFTTVNYLKMHERFHLGRSFPCKYGCEGVAFPNAASLVKHLRAVHPGLNLKEYIREKNMKERIMRQYSNNGEAMWETSYSMFSPGIGFQAKRGRPKGSKNTKKIKSLLAEQYNASPSQNVGISVKKEVSNPLSEVKSENNNIPRSRFMFKCKLCPKSFSYHLRLLQHRSKVHGLPQSVQEYLHEMSKDVTKDVTESSESDQEWSLCRFSPPPSPKSFFPNINARGAENMQKFIDGGLESVEKYRRAELEHILAGEDIKPMVKLEWTHYNFPLNFKYRDDPTVFYDSKVETSHAISTKQTKVTDDSMNEEGKIGETVTAKDKSKIAQMPHGVCGKVPSDTPASVISDDQTEKSKKKKGEDHVKDNERLIGDIGRTDSPEIMENSIIDSPVSDKKIEKCADTDTDAEFNATNQGRTVDLDLGFSSRNQPSSFVQTEAPSSQSDSAYSSLSSWLSGSSETEDLSSHSLLNKVLIELENQSLTSSKKSKGFDDNITQDRINFGSKLSSPLGISTYHSPRTHLMLRALNLCSDGRVERKKSHEKEFTLKGVNMTLIKALDLPNKDIAGVVERLSQTNFSLDVKKQGTGNLLSGRCHRSSTDHHSDSILNMSDSSKHDHRRYSIWSRQHSHKTHSKNAELFGCPVVECVRKAQIMKEKASWKGCSDVGHIGKQRANQKKKETFASELGLMNKRDYNQSYHMKQQENYCIKPPDIWKVYDKIWFGKRGVITVVCSMCHRHFSCLELCLRHQLKKHPHIEPLSLEMEKGNYVEDLYYYYPMAYGILAHTQLIPDNMPAPEVYVCTRCSFPFKNINKLHSHIIICDPSQGEATGRVQSYKKKRLLPMMDRRCQDSTSSKTDVRKPSMHNMHSNSFKNPGRSEIVKKGYVMSDLRKINLKPVVRAEPKPSAVRSSSFKSDFFSVLPGHRRRKNFGLLYNPSNHTRRRELYQVLDQHQCHGCNLKFKSMSLLERHVKKCSGKDKLQSQKPLLSGLTDDVALRKQHTCRYCNKRFTYIKGVDLHYKRICSVRKVKEEENTLTAEDLAHEAELQRIIEHMKWSKSLNKDSSDIILGHVRVEEDGTLIRVNKKRGRPFGKNRRRLKKKGFKWTTLKRHRSEEGTALSDGSLQLSGSSEKSEGDKEKDTNLESPSPTKKGKSRIEVKTVNEDPRKRKLPPPEADADQPPPRKRGRPRKTDAKPAEKTEKGKAKRGRPRKTERKETNGEVDSHFDSCLQTVNSVTAQEVGTGSHCRKEGNNFERQENNCQNTVKPPTRKRGRPKKFDPSDMESSYKKRKHQANYNNKSNNNAVSGREISETSKTSLMEHKKTEGEEKCSMSVSKFKSEPLTSDGPKSTYADTKGKIKKETMVDKEAKSISIFETAELQDVDGKSVEAHGEKDVQRSSAKSKVVKISRVQNKTSTPEQNCSPESEKKVQDIDRTERKNSENSSSKQEHSKMKSPDKLPASEELLKYLTSDTSSSPVKSEAKFNSNNGDVEKGATVPVEISNLKEVISKAKCVKIVSIASNLLSPKKVNPEGEKSSNGSDKGKEDQFALSDHKVKQKSTETNSSQEKTATSNSNVIVSKSQPVSVALSPPSTSARSQVMHTPLSVRVIAVPAGASKLVSSPSTIKLIKSPIAGTSSSSKLTSPEVVNVVSNPFINSTSPKSLSPGRANPVSLPSPCVPGSKPVTVIHNPGVLRNISPSSFPLVSGSSIQLPRIIKGNVASSTLRLPQVISGGIRLPQAIGSQLGSAVIVQPAAILQGKAKVGVVPTNIRTPPSRFTCNTVPVKVGTVPTGAKIVKLNNLGPPVEVKHGGAGLVTSPGAVHRAVSPATVLVDQQVQPVKVIVEGHRKVLSPTPKGEACAEGNPPLLDDMKKE